jgi:hypothetical protein
VCHTFVCTCTASLSDVGQRRAVADLLRIYESELDDVEFDAPPDEGTEWNLAAATHYAISLYTTIGESDCVRLVFTLDSTHRLRHSCVRDQQGPRLYVRVHPDRLPSVRLCANRVRSRRVYGAYRSVACCDCMRSMCAT